MHPRARIPASNWMLEFTVQAQNPLVLSVVNPKVVPRAIMFVCGMLAAPGTRRHSTSSMRARRPQVLAAVARRS